MPWVGAFAGALGIGVPAGYTVPVIGFFTVTTRMPFNSFCVGSVSTLRGFSTWRKPS